MALPLPLSISPAFSPSLATSMPTPRRSRRTAAARATGATLERKSWMKTSASPMRAAAPTAALSPITLETSRPSSR
ncbi:hypothetical protein TCAP_03384 [Tolypocladium capitatum]|uniref:Uncharacterized protein n=1 Tax=Tolypocladium capitatum TaxID=45235 RepID=A0A2K3QGK7_9HYPO|nr:hypothetical protein TCAP_03384 [Tolypocladium capitatum]